MFFCVKCMQVTPAMRLLVMCPLHIPLINWLHSYVQRSTHISAAPVSSSAQRSSTQHPPTTTGVHASLLTAQILRMHGVKVDRKESTDPQIGAAVLLSAAQDLYEQYAMIREILPSRCESEQRRLLMHPHDPASSKASDVDRRPLDVSTGCSVFFETAATMLHQVLNPTPAPHEDRGPKHKGTAAAASVANVTPAYSRSSRRLPSLLAVVSSLHDVRQAAAAWSAGKHAAGFGSYGLLRPTQLQVTQIKSLFLCLLSAA